MPTLRFPYGVVLSSLGVVACVGFLTANVHAQGMLGGGAQDGNFQLSATPQSFDQVQQQLDQISQNMDTAQCGGWNLDKKVPQYMSTVSGVPGRYEDPLGNSGSGMGKRIEQGGRLGDGFQYPGGATWGFSTACKLNSEGKEDVHIWCGGDPNAANAYECTKQVDYPKLGDPHLCLWWNDKNQRENNPDLPLSQNTCTQSCDWMNNGKFAYMDCKPKDVVYDDAAKKWTCTKQSPKWTCSELWVDEHDPVQDPRNCHVCVGENCRCGKVAMKTSSTSSVPTSLVGMSPSCTVAVNQRPLKRGQGNDQPYQSFFRHYEAATNRKTLPEVPKDALGNVRAQVQCYGIYNEFDAKTKMTTMMDQRCVIGNIKTDGQEYSEKDLRKKLQKGKGLFRAASPPPDPLPAVRPYNEATDVWFTKIFGSLSFLKPESDLTKGLLQVEKGVQKASVQNTDANPYAFFSIERATDDTVSNERLDVRPFTAWWQQFQTDVHRLFTPSVVHLKLPGTWNADLTPLDPVNVERDPRTQTIDVQLQAKDDLTGVIAAYLQKTLLLNIREEPIPVVVPLASPVELRSYAVRWETWKAQRKQLQKDVPGEVDALIEKLRDYADAIEGERRLRSALPEFLAKFLDKQKNFVVQINQWAAKNEGLYKQYQAQATARMELLKKWQVIGTTAQQFDDQVNFPWCKNDRYTTPIYSLLDPWLPGRPDLFGGIPTCDQSQLAKENPPPPGTPKTSTGSLPLLCVPYADAEFTYDLSRLKISTGSLVIPVLHPIQVRLNIPTPGGAMDDIPKNASLILPDFPPIVDLSKSFLQLVPVATLVSTPPSLPSPPVTDLAVATKTLDRVKSILEKRNMTYLKFWKSLTYRDPDSGQVPKCGKTDIGPLDCCTWGDLRCQHTEVDLLERFTRITARPAVQLREDLLNQGIARTPVSIPGQLGKRTTMTDAVCNPADHSCPAMLRQKDVPPTGWQILLPDRTAEQDLINVLRSQAREQTISPEGQIIGDPPVPYLSTPTDLYPVFTVPTPTTLKPLPQKPR